jgi:hypothetical protein
MRKLFPISFAALLVLTMACEKAHFVQRPDGSGAGQGGGTVGVGGAAGGTGGVGGAAMGGSGGGLCQLSTQDCSKQSPTDPCDPVCQSGTCPCGQKCSYAGTDAKPVCADRGARKTLESCTVTYPGLPSQYDDCVPGNICLAPALGLPTYCFKLCYQDSDCLSYADCGKRPLSSSGGVVSVCSPAHQLCGTDSSCCDPLADSNNGCPSTNPVCFLVAPDIVTPPSGFGHSRTVCEYSAGAGVADSTTPCASSRDCMAKLACADEDHLCHPVCDPAKPVCPSGMTCKAWGTEYGYCIAS